MVVGERRPSRQTSTRGMATRHSAGSERRLCCLHCLNLATGDLAKERLGHLQGLGPVDAASG
jgi:hypothetical protein